MRDEFDGLHKEREWDKGRGIGEGKPNLKPDLLSSPPGPIGFVFFRLTLLRRQTVNGQGILPSNSTSII